MTTVCIHFLGTSVQLNIWFYMLPGFMFVIVKL